MRIPNWPNFESDEINKTIEILKSGLVNYWTGNETKLFEKEFSSFCGTNYAIAIANGSLALSSAYLSLNFNKGDEIITTPRTFIATASSAVLLGLKPIFADVDFDSGLITPETIKPLISTKTRGICVVHLGGWPADIQRIKCLADENNLKLIEDCSQAHGAGVFNDEIGSFQSVGSFGDVNTWSFCQDKIISTGGEGGMITTNNIELMEKIWSLKDHGKSKKLVEQENKNYSFNWIHNDLGSNFRLTEMQSAIGRLQLRKMHKWQEIRTNNASILADTLKDNKLIRIPLPNPKFKHAWYKFNCFLNLHYLKSDWNRERIIAEIRAKNYPAFSGGCSEVYLENCFKKYNLSPLIRCKNAKLLGETNLMFLIHPTINKKQMLSYALCIKDILNKATN